ncbi:PEP/pyruvate-binding domain-containing protein [Neomegalonema sp.]|uniref:PEP/pyruvate-binding domain-containing protein n=1 Tax=Neomegalonema sp. TaxID=2039713 RepID=UPI00263653AC|nr:PEP/pyruvate-binding domain-containing protein [Neomegalonema sp.]MDD2867061.1 PEP/pyruvate-binding domain-containing protein [Neomegalonema sp.]
MILTGEAARDSARAGGKAAALARLQAEGFEIPPFFALEGEAADLREALAALGPGPYAVRSSGREEDGASHSHAGQFLSLLNIPAEGVAEAARKVRDSGLTDSLRAYRAARGLDPEGGAPAVLVQRMIAPRAAGVAFTADPVTGERGVLLISAVEGLADRLVGGEVEGEDWRLDARGHATSASEGPRVLTEADLKALADLGRALEAKLKGPQDFEWAFEGEKLWLLQARPITTLPASLLAPPDPALTVFDNSNIVESYPGVVSTLTYGFAQYVYARVYQRLLGLLGVKRETISDHREVLENLLARADGRVYYNLANWRKALGLLPGARLNAQFMDSMMGLDEPLPADLLARLTPPPAQGLARFGEYARLGGAGLRLFREWLRLPGRIRLFEQRLEAALARPAGELKGLPFSALAEEYRRIEAQLLERWDAPLVNDFLCMIAFGSSRKMLEQAGGDRGLTLHNDVMIGQGDIVSAEPAKRIREMGALARREPALMEALRRNDSEALAAGALGPPLAGYLARFADRCAEELKLESVTLDEDPRPLHAAVLAAAGKPESAGPPPPLTEADVKARLKEIAPKRPVWRLLARRRLAQAKTLVRHRENLRFERTRIFGRARRLFLEMGARLTAAGKLEAPRDVLHLTHLELLGAVEGFGADLDLKGLVALRKPADARSLARPAPPARLRIEGAALTGLDQALAAPRASGPRSADEERKGTGCSAGLARGAAKIILDPRTESLAPGEILVAPHTDPGWIALFANASALVVERGSLLSHSAIVARELGIPCVVGLKGATAWLVSGEEIEVDGAGGFVRRLKS